MPRHAAYSCPSNPAKSCNSRIFNVRCSFKNTREAAHSISHYSLTRAKTFLQNVIDHKEAVPFTRYVAGVGGTPQVKTHPMGKGVGRWPQQSCRYLLQLLANAESNAVVKNLNVDRLHIARISVQQAPKIRRRIYRAHGRINPFVSHPCHIEVTLTEKDKAVSDPPSFKSKNMQNNAMLVSRNSSTITSE